MTELQLENPPIFGVVQRRSGFMADLRRTGEFVATERLNAQYGVQALHGHYPVGSSELVLEFVEGETLRTRVVSRGEVTNLVPTVWGFTTDGTHVPIQWGVNMPGSGVSDSDLSRIGEFLAVNGLTCTFSVVRLPLAVKVSLGETVLLEETDKQARTQISRIMPRGMVPSCDDATWAFADDGTPVAIACCVCKKCG